MKRVVLSLTLAYALCMGAGAREASAAVPGGSGSAIADVVAGNSRVDFMPRVHAAGFVLTVGGPDGAVEQQDLDPGRPILFTVAGSDGNTRPDGIYYYELRAKAAPVAAPELATSAIGPEAENGRSAAVAAAVRAHTPSSGGVQSGTFWIQGGTIVAGDALEPRAARLAAPEASTGSGRTANVVGRTILDQVIADDLIVQGSGCFGIDCVNNEVFGFDTIRVKENNTRLQFTDTSTSVGFPANNWQIRANSSASGGANFLAFVDQGTTGDSETGTIVMEVNSGAPANSLFVSSSGRVGFRTSTPVLDLHVNTNNTPGIRLDQNSSGGFTAQAWDIAGNETNFFIRDVTGGSRLPFKIRPGALTDSLVIGANGNVGIGMASPAGSLDLNTSGVQMNYYFGQGGVRRWRFVVNNADPNLYIWDQTAAAYRLTLASGSGFVGIGTTSPSHPLQMGSGAFVSAGGVWTNASSRSYKQDIRDLDAESALETLGGLAPVTYTYKAAPGEHHVGFIAEDAPALVATPDRKGMSPMDVAAILTKVVQEQQKTIRDLSERLARLEAQTK